MSYNIASNTIDLRQRTRYYAVSIIRIFTDLPRSTEAQIIGKQMLRSGTSVGANYREAYRARSGAECIAKMGICLQELEETLYWLELLIDTEIRSAQQVDHLFDETNQLIAIFISSIKRRKSNLHEEVETYDMNSYT